MKKRSTKLSSGEYESRFPFRGIEENTIRQFSKTNEGSRIRTLVMIILSLMIIFTFEFLISDSSYDTSSYATPNKLQSKLRTGIHLEKILLTYNMTKYLELTPCSNDTKCTQWKTNLENKLMCMFKSCGAIFHYHVRKAAGTSIRRYLQTLSYRFSLTNIETEGIAIDHHVFRQQGIMSFISLRDPVERIISLFWYEHVLYYLNVEKKPWKASNLWTWVETWRDGHPWKQNFTDHNPRNVYMEIENYYVKMLVNWDGSFNITREHLEQAKNVLRQFDNVLTLDIFNGENLKRYFNLFIPDPCATYQFRTTLRLLKGDKSLIKAYQQSLASDEEYVRVILRDINQFDIELYEYAKRLALQRAVEINNLLFNRIRDLKDHKSAISRLTNQWQSKSKRMKFYCSYDLSCETNITEEMKMLNFVFRPPDHKAPVNGSIVSARSLTS